MNNDWETRYFDFTFTLKGLSSTEVERAVKRFVTKERKIVCQETRDEDNKRFLEYVGEDEVLNNDPHDVFEDADKIAKNELRQELRDKVNKK